MYILRSADVVPRTVFKNGSEKYKNLLDLLDGVLVTELTKLPNPMFILDLQFESPKPKLKLTPAQTYIQKSTLKKLFYLIGIKFKEGTNDFFVYTNRCSCAIIKTDECEFNIYFKGHEKRVQKVY